jgi:hypothetical protein
MSVLLHQAVQLKKDLIGNANITSIDFLDSSQRTAGLCITSIFDKS